MAAVPSIGRANRIEGVTPAEADTTRALYEQYANQIFRYCLHQLGSREEAEDAVQSTFLNAFRGLRRGVVPEMESAWLFKIAHNVCLSRRRSSWRRGRIESPADFEVVEELTAAPSRRVDELIGLQDVLEQMPESQRRAILLREWQGLSYREIADELDLSQAAVETLIFRARRALAAGLEQPPAPRRGRVARAADLGTILAALKSTLLGGGAAVKVAAAVAVVGATSVVAAGPLERQLGRHHTAPATPARAPSVSTAAKAPSRILPPVVPAPARAAAHVPAARPAHARPAAGRRGRPAAAHAVRPRDAGPTTRAPTAPAEVAEHGHRSAPAAETPKPSSGRGRSSHASGTPRTDHPKPKPKTTQAGGRANAQPADNAAQPAENAAPQARQKDAPPRAHGRPAPDGETAAQQDPAAAAAATGGTPAPPAAGTGPPAGRTKPHGPKPADS